MASGEAERIVWLREDVVLAVQRRLIAEHGGEDGVRDAGLLTSALARPLNLLAYGDPSPDVAALGAAYAYGIARNHPFVDGNKRVALVAARTFLRLNGWDLAATQAEKYRVFYRLAEGTVSEDGLAAWLREHVVRLSPRPSG